MFIYLFNYRFANTKTLQRHYKDITKTLQRHYKDITRHYKDITNLHNNKNKSNMAGNTTQRLDLQ